MRLQPTRNLSQGCVIWQEMQKGYHQSRPKLTMTNMFSAVFCSDLALSEKSIRQRERFCLEILREIQHSVTENKDKMTWGVGADRCPFSMGKTTVPFIPSGECCDQPFRWQWMMTFW